MSRLLAVAALVAACHHAAPAPAPAPAPARAPTHLVAAPALHTLTIFGTSDTHGQIDRLPILAGYVDNVRAARAADGGAVLLVDAGDLFQGTLESNLAEGVPVIAAFNVMKYDAVALGNHEFDFGPVGPAVTVQHEGEDPRGALKARAAEAHFPILAANLIDAASGQRVDWPNFQATTIVHAAGATIGIVGVTTSATPVTTMPANFVGLAVADPAETITKEATALRKAGATIVVVAAHLGGKCGKQDDPDDTSSCDPDQEIMKVAPAIPKGLVDVIVAGHTHQGMAHRIAGIPVVESWNSVRAFGRVDLAVDQHGRVTDAKIFPPREVCAKPPGDAAPCAPGEYEGKPVVPSDAVEQAVEPAIEAASAKRAELVGATLATPIVKSYDAESAEGNLFADLMLAASPGADVAITNGGGLRADLPKGPLTYGSLFLAMPFDNHFAKVKMRGADLRAWLADNLGGSGGIVSIAGATVVARCDHEQLAITLYDRRHKKIADDRALVISTSDFLASGGDGTMGKLHLPDGAVTLTDVLVRDAMAAELAKRHKPLEAAQVFDAKKPRLAYTGTRPIKCEK
jgi:5'-nucleotidase